MPVLDERIQQALARGHTIDITTTGRRTGRPRRIEIWFHNVDGRFYISGRPGRRGWYANLRANPEFTFHLKQTVRADLPARATVIHDPAERRTIMQRILRQLDRSADLEAWVRSSPLVEVEVRPPIME